MSYQAPLRDMRFVLHELFDISGHCQLLGNGLDRELIDGVLEEGARYAAEVVAPLNRNSDEQGCQLSDGQVRTPDGFAEAYQQYVDNGWASMTGPSEYGGQALPQMLACNFHEMLMAASLSFRVYSGLTELIPATQTRQIDAGGGAKRSRMALYFCGANRCLTITFSSRVRRLPI